MSQVSCLTTAKAFLGLGSFNMRRVSRARDTTKKHQINSYWLYTVSAVFARAVNTLLITRREDAEMLRFPYQGKTYRGGGLPDECRSFYTVGKQLRVAGFLATSFSKGKAEDFMCMADERDESCVLWEIHIDPEGKNSRAHRCKHVNYVAFSHMPGEEEYLYAPYSPFTVKKVSKLQLWPGLCVYACTCGELERLLFSDTVFGGFI